ncbi:MAG: aldehyde dehydrogenase family protein [Anaerolineae bacterium]
MPLQPVLIASEWRETRSSNNAFTAINPTTKNPLADRYPVSDEVEIELALNAAQQAKVVLRSVAPKALAYFLERFADAIEAHREELVDICYQETALPKEPRLNSVELPRTTNQLRQAAAAVRDRF